MTSTYFSKRPLCDIGANLTNKSFAKDLDTVIERAFDANVQYIVITGTSVKNSQDGQALAGRFPGQLYSTAGVHPHDAKSCDAQTLPALKELAATPEVVAIGECGLDFNRDFSPRDTQEKWFEAQLELACELGMPVFLHERDAHQRFCDILKGYRDKLVAAVIHCFTGTEDELRAYLDMDLHVGVTGWICDERRGHHLRELVGQIPADRLMIETDSPYLMPRDLKPKPKNRRNEPSFLPHILETIAECVGVPVEDVADATTQTAKTFFRLS